MIKLLQCEYRKTRGKYIFFTALSITLIQLCWALYGNYTEFTIKNGWLMFLYRFPLVNAIFMPLLSIIVSSRLCDIEHKGSMFIKLLVIVEKGKIYDAKLICGFLIVLFCNILSWCVTIIFGYIKGFDGDVPIMLYLLYLLFTVVPTLTIYVFHHIISLLFKNQAITFFAGIIGTFCGLFSMFFPQFPIIRKLLIWGYYGVLQFVGMFGWTKEERYLNVRFEVMNIDWLFFVILIIICVVMYIIGKKLFCKREV